MCDIFWVCCDPGFCRRRFIFVCGTPWVLRVFYTGSLIAIRTFLTEGAPPPPPEPPPFNSAVGPQRGSKMIDPNLSKNSLFGIVRNTLKIDLKQYHTFSNVQINKVWYVFGSILRAFRKIPNGEFLVKFVSIISGPPWGPTADLNEGSGGRSPPGKKTSDDCHAQSVIVAESSF